MRSSITALGRVDHAGHLIEADPLLLELHLHAGGTSGGPLAIPQIAFLAKLAQNLGILVSRSVIAAKGAQDVDLWVRAEPEGSAINLKVGGWAMREARQPSAEDSDREHDFLRAGADWLWETDESLKVVALSASAERVIGQRASAVIGRPLTRLLKLEEDDEGYLPLVDALAAKTSFEDQPARVREGDARMRLSALAVFDGVGRFRGFRGSAAWASTSDLDADDDLAVPDAFGERLDNALRRPLERILSNAENIILQAEGPLRRDYAQYARDITTAGRHLMALAGDLVDLQAIERPDFAILCENIDLEEALTRATALLAGRASVQNITLERLSPPGTLIARGEFRRVVQILVNLIDNAVRYSPAEGTVRLSCQADRELAVVIVADQGKGIAPADQERIFEKFERVDHDEPGGSGIGLYIARLLARAMGGDIEVESGPEKGAQFIFSLKKSL